MGIPFVQALDSITLFISLLLRLFKYKMKAPLECRIKCPNSRDDPIKRGIRKRTKNR